MSMPLSGNFGFPHLKFTLKQNQSYFYILKLGVLLLHCWVCHSDVLIFEQDAIIQPLISAKCDG